MRRAFVLVILTLATLFSAPSVHADQPPLKLFDWVAKSYVGPGQGLEGGQIVTIYDDVVLNLPQIGADYRLGRVVMGPQKGWLRTDASVRGLDDITIGGWRVRLYQPSVNDRGLCWRAELQLPLEARQTLELQNFAFLADGGFGPSSEDVARISVGNLVLDLDGASFTGHDISVGQLSLTFPDSLDGVVLNGEDQHIDSKGVISGVRPFQPVTILGTIATISRIDLSGETVKFFATLRRGDGSAIGDGLLEISRDGLPLVFSATGSGGRPLDLLKGSDRPEWTLFRAIHNGDSGAVRRLLSGRVSVDANFGGLTPLLAAAAEARDEVLSTLISLKANVNAKAPDGATSLQIAARKSDLRATQLLLKAGADPNTLDAKGVTPLQEAIMMDRPEIARILLGYRQNREALEAKGLSFLRRAAGTDVELVKLLLANGVKPDVDEPQQASPLDFAFSYDKRDCALALVDALKDPDRMGVDGESPLADAVLHGWTDVALRLIKRGVRADSVDLQGNTPLAYAMDGGQRDVVAALTAAGAMTPGIRVFSRLVGGPPIQSVVGAPDGGFWTAGRNSSDDLVGYGFTKVTSQGNPLFCKMVSLPSVDSPSISAVPGGDVIVGAVTYMPIGARLTPVVWLARLDQVGGLVWSMFYTPQDLISARFCAAPDGSVLVFGIGGPGGLATDRRRREYVFKAGPDGKVVFAKTIGDGAGVTHISKVVPGDDGTFFCVGNTDSSGAGGSDAWVCKLDQDGAVLWEHSFGSPWDEVFTAACPDGVGGIIATGTNVSPTRYSSMSVARISANGELLWKRLAGEAIHPDFITRFGDGYCIGGKLQPLPKDEDFAIIRVDGEGRSTECLGFDEGMNETAMGAAQTADGGLLIVGTRETGRGSELPRNWLLKVRADLSGIARKSRPIEPEDMMWRAGTTRTSMKDFTVRAAVFNVALWNVDIVAHAPKLEFDEEREMR